MKIAILIPTYNEVGAIGQVLDALLLETERMSQHAFSMLIIDGQSKDDTQKVVKEKMLLHKNIYLLIEKEKKGLGNAYVAGMNHAIDVLGADAFVEFDGDFQHDPKDLHKLIEKLDEGYDYIIGSRYISGGTIPREWPWYRKFLSSAGNLIVRIGLNVHVRDATSGFKLTKVKNNKEKIPLGEGVLISLRHAYKIHFLYALVKGGARTVEVPIHFLNRNKGISKSTFEDIIESLKVVGFLALAGRFRRKRLENKK